MIKKYLHFFLFFLRQNKIFGQKSSIMRVTNRIKCKLKKWRLPDGLKGNSSYWGPLVQKRPDFVLLEIKPSTLHERSLPYKPHAYSIFPL